ncbi:amino acid/polyamine transporter I [Fusarium sp. MPI-SDFR-AT-0072]|nr:amino acid/polyamine transporter I [Fusarium sp. MPI-SDFR-AT-0072]
MKKNMGPLTMIAVCFNICNGWAGISASLQIALLQGGPATLLYGLFVSSSLYMGIALTMAELASVYPTAGGQYHFASILAPKRINRRLSYACALLTMLSWVSIGSAILMIPSAQILAFVQYCHPNFVQKPWHYFLIYEAVGLIPLAYNVLALKKLPRTHDVGFVLTIFMFCTLFVTMLARSSPKADNTFVWGTFINSTGWPDGVCFFTGMLPTCFIYSGLDASLHLAEEAKNPRVSVPRASVLTISIGFVTATCFTIALLYSISDYEGVLAIQEYLPFEINRQVMRSDVAASVFLLLGIVMTLFILNAVIQTSSRITWALARDDALVFSKYFQQIHPSLGVPVRALLLNWSILAICGCVFLGSSIAFNALLGSAVVLQQLSFVIPTALLLYQRRSETYLPKDRAFRLPSVLGWVVNVWVVGLATVLSTFFLLPPFLPVTAGTMNYNCVILGIAAMLGVLNWMLHARKHYQGPRIVLEE